VENHLGVRGVLLYVERVLGKQEQRSWKTVLDALEAAEDAAAR
jgi:hypothetical protein